MGLSDIVNVTVSLSAPSLTAPGFGTPLVLMTASDTPAGMTNRVRVYTSESGAAADLNAAAGTLLQLAKMFSQNPTVQRAKVGRMASDFTQVFTMVPVIVNSAIYTGTVDGFNWTFTASGSATAQNVNDGILAALVALDSGNLVDTSGSPVSAATLRALEVPASPSTTSITLTAKTAGQFHSVSVGDITLITFTESHSAPGTMAADLAAIQLEDPAWYALLCPFTSKAVITAMDTFVEANGKLAIAATCDSACATVAPSSDTGGSQSIAEALSAGTALRTALWYHRYNGEFEDAAAAGRCLPLDPGSETWAFKQLAGVTAEPNFTETQRANLIAKHCNFYEAISAPNSTSSVSVTNPGQVSGNEYIDVIRFRDWVQVNVQVEVFNVLQLGNKLPYTDPGIAAVQGAILAVLARGVKVGGLVPGSQFCTVPLAASVSSGDRSARLLEGVNFGGQLAGAIQVVDISGTLTH